MHGVVGDGRGSRVSFIPGNHPKNVVRKCRIVQDLVNRRRHLYAIACVGFFFAALLPTGVHAKELRTVKQVIDGDTILLENGEVVSLIGVDAPEIKHATKAGAGMGKESAAFVRKLVEGKRVRLEFDPANANHKDNRKRTLAYVFLEGGTFVNAEIIKHGYGFTFPGFVHKYQSEFRRLEGEARENKRGLWGKEP
jgi:micrococcal nuclease